MAKGKQAGVQAQVGLHGQEQRGPDDAGEWFPLGTQQGEPFGLGEPLTRGPEIGQRAADEVEL